jgi:hypothetical protein
MNYSCFLKVQVVYFLIFLAALKPEKLMGQIICRKDIVVNNDTTGISCSMHAWANGRNHIKTDTAFRDLEIDLKMETGDIKNFKPGEGIIWENLVEFFKLCIPLKYHRLVININDKYGDKYPQTVILYRSAISYHYDNEVDWLNRKIVTPKVEE